jgi:hypothetical protein
MFIIDETANARSQVTFYRCSICVSEHVSSEPVFQAASNESSETFDAPAADTKRYLMV